jgi:hypothetical protein
MRTRTLALACAALVLGTGIALAASGVAQAGPNAVKGLTTTVVTVQVTVSANSVQQAEPACADKQVLTGGGYQVASVGSDDKVFINAPLDNQTWLVEMVNNSAFDIQLSAFAVCLGKA